MNALNPKDFAALGPDAAELVDQLRAALEALTWVRSGSLHLDGQRDPATLADLTAAISAVTAGLAPRIDGLSRHLVRVFLEAGGSYGELATAMNTARSTAQSRAQAITRQEVSVWEDWAAGPGEKEPAPAPVELDPTLPEGLVIRWGQETVRDLLQETSVLTRKHTGWVIEPGNAWDPLTATAYYLDSAAIGSPDETRVLFLAADGRWVIRDPQINTPYRRAKFYWANEGEALRFLEESGDRGAIARHFPSAGS